MTPARRDPAPAADCDAEAEPDDLVNRLTDYDERLRLGFAGDVAADSTVTAAADPEVDSLYECLNFLEAAWPRAPAAQRPQMPAEIGRFRLERVLGVGGFGIVYKAYDPKLRRSVALKVPRLHSLADEKLRARFQREARAAAALDHPDIVPIHEVGEEGPVCYLVAAYCEGPNLAEWLKTRTEPVPIRQAAELTRRLAAAVQYSHAQGVLHRDLKPSNVLLVREEHAAKNPTDELPFAPRISDFGLAKLLEEGADDSTSLALGTPAYMAPEQAGVGPSSVGPTADVYGLGAMLYELLAGRPPFPGGTIANVIEQLRHSEPVPPRRLRREIPRDLEAICLKCLEKQTSRRYATAGELADDLQRCLNGEPTKARPQDILQRAGRTLGRPNVRNRVIVSALLLAVAVLAVTARQFHQSSVAARIKEEARLQAEFIPADEQYRRDIARADSLLHEAALTGSDRIQAAAEARDILERSLPRAGAPDRRGFEWHYLRQALEPSKLTPRLAKLHEIPAHEGDAYFVTFSADGSRLATAGKDGKAHVWDTATGRRVTTLQGHSGDVNWVDFSPDGGTLVTASDDQTVRLWDAASGQLKQILWTHTAPVIGAAFNPVNRHVAAVAFDGTIRVWDLSGPTEVFNTISHHSVRIEALAWSPDGRLLATVNLVAGVQLWDASKSYAPYEPLPSAEGGETVCFSQDGRLIATAQGAQVCVRRVATGELLAKNDVVQKGGFRSLRFLDDDRTLVGAGHETANALIDWMSGTSWGPFETTVPTWCAAVSSDGKQVAVTDFKGTLTIWDSSARRRVDRREIEISVKPQEVPQFALAPDGTRLIVTRSRDAATGHSGIAFYDLTAPQPRLLDYGDFNYSPDETCEIFDLSFSPDTREVAVALIHRQQGNQLKYFNAATGTIVRGASTRWELPLIQRALYSPDGSNLVTLHLNGDAGCEMRFWLPSTGKLRHGMLSGPARSTDPLSGNAAAFSPQGDVFATTWMGPNNRLEFFRVSDLSRIATWVTFPRAVDFLVFTPDGRRVVIKLQGGLCSLYDRETRETIWTLDSGLGPVLAISPDGRTLALAREDAVLLMQAETGKLLCPLRFPKTINGLHDLTFSADGKVLAAKVQFYDKTWKVCYWRIDGMDQPVQADSP